MKVINSIIVDLFRLTKIVGRHISCLLLPATATSNLFKKLSLSKNILMITIDYQSIIQRSSKLVSSNMDGETVMMSIESGEYFGLNSVGSRMWELIENPIKVNTLIELLLDEFDVSREQCEAETMEFLNHLFEKKLLTIIPPK